MRRKNRRGRRKSRIMRKVDWKGKGKAEAEGHQSLELTTFPTATATAPQARRSNATAKKPNA